MGMGGIVEFVEGFLYLFRYFFSFFISFSFCLVFFFFSLYFTHPSLTSVNLDYDHAIAG